MASALNRTTKQFYGSVNTPDFSVDIWIINPDMTPVAGFPSKYWIITGDVVSLMTQGQRDAVDDAALLVSAQSAAAFQIGAFGDGVDGTITVVANSTLAQDKYYQQVTVNAAVTVTIGGFRVFASEWITNNGTLTADGGAAAGAAVGAAAASGTLRGGAAGAAGGVGIGTAGTALTTGAAPGAGGVGGAGGLGSGGAGGAGGLVPVGTAYRARPRRAFAYFDLGDADAGQASLYVMFAGGAGGGAGGGGGAGQNSGGGGGGGGVLCLGAPGILNAGMIAARGGAGGNAVGTNSGGGGGGGGGLAVLGRLYRRGTGSIVVTGGAAGTGTGTGVAGTAGADGRLQEFVMTR